MKVCLYFFFLMLSFTSLAAELTCSKNGTAINFVNGYDVFDRDEANKEMIGLKISLNSSLQLVDKKRMFDLFSLMFLDPM